MRSPSFSLGTVFGVELRLHVYTVVAMLLLLMYAGLMGLPLSRGFLLWLLLFAAVAVREVTRAIVAAWAGLELRRLVLLPIGAIPSYAQDVPAGGAHERLLALAGPVANFAAALTLALLTFSATSQVNLFQRHIVEPEHLLRAAIWLQVMLGGLQLLPAAPLDGGVLVRRQWPGTRTLAGSPAGTAAGDVRRARASTSLGQAFGWVLVALGAISQEMVVILLGGTVLLLAQTDGHALQAKEAVSRLTVRDVMLHEWTQVDASDTLEDALRRTTHSLQDVFPVLRGNVVVGSVARSSLLFTLRTQGNGYVQSVMTRTVRAVRPDDGLVDAARGGTGAAVVVEADRVVGVLTPQHLLHAMALLGRTHRLLRRPDKRGHD